MEQAPLVNSFFELFLIQKLQDQEHQSRAQAQPARKNITQHNHHQGETKKATMKKKHLFIKEKRSGVFSGF